MVFPIFPHSMSSQFTTPLANQVREIVEQLNNPFLDLEEFKTLMRSAIQLRIQSVREHDSMAEQEFWHINHLRHELSGHFLCTLANSEHTTNALWRVCLQDLIYTPTTPTYFLLAAKMLDSRHAERLHDLQNFLRDYPAKFAWVPIFSHLSTERRTAASLILQDKALEECTFSDVVKAWKSIRVTDSSDLRYWENEFSNFLKTSDIPLLPIHMDETELQNREDG